MSDILPALSGFMRPTGVRLLFRCQVELSTLINDIPARSGSEGIL